jgi:hypothetical protein
MTKRKPACLTRKARRGNVDYAMGRILKENPGITESESLPIFRTKVLADDDLLEACVFECHASARNRAYRGIDDALTREEKRLREMERRRARDARVAEMYERGKAVLILNHIMPNGLPLRDCTFAYAKEVGGAFARIGGMGEPDQIIGEVLSDDQADAAAGELVAANGHEAVEREGPAFRARLRQLEREQAERA